MKFNLPVILLKGTILIPQNELKLEFEDELAKNIIETLKPIREKRAYYESHLDEVDRILANMGMSRIDLANDLAEGKKVKITNGPFKNMIGKIASYDLEKKKVELLLDLFGQETSVEVELSEIENLK